MDFLCCDCFKKIYGKKIGDKKICLSVKEKECECCHRTDKVVIGLEPSIVEIMLGSLGSKYNDMF